MFEESLFRWLATVQTAVNDQDTKAMGTFFFNNFEIHDILSLSLVQANLEAMGFISLAVIASKCVSCPSQEYLAEMGRNGINAILRCGYRQFMGTMMMMLVETLRAMHGQL